MNKKTLILLSSLALVIILAGSFVWFFTKNNNSQKNNIGVNTDTSTDTKKSSNTLVETGSQNTVQNIPTDLIKKEVDVKAVNQDFLNKIPNISNEQLDSFYKIVLDGDMDKCENLGKDHNQCKYYFAIYKSNGDFCADISDANLSLFCYKKLIFNTLQTRFDKCNYEENIDLKVNCLNSLFWAIKDVKSCEIFSNDFVRQSCIDSTILKITTTKNKENCADIKDVGIKDLCNQSFIVGDFDEDGVNDDEELRIGTNPYVTDTDNDNTSDQEEISSGSNPCGDGKMPSSKILLEMCAKFKK